MKKNILFLFFTLLITPFTAISQNSNSKPKTLDELQPEVQNFITSKPYFPLEAELEGITSRRQILLVNNGKKTNDYIFKNGVIKAEISLTKGLNEIVFAVENAEGADIMRLQVTYKTPKTKKDEYISESEQLFRHKITTYAQKFKDIPYQYGGETPSGFDCSGLVQYAMNEYDLKLPRVSREQARMGKRVRQSKAQPGDLVFYKSGGKVSHVSIVLERSEDTLLVIHSTKSRGVIVEDIMKSNYWLPKMSYIRDIISDKF